MIDKKVYYAGTAALAVLILGLGVQGCDLQKMVKFDVPKGVQGAIETNETETLSNSDYVWSQWENWVQANSNALAANISDANERVALINDVTALGMGALGEVSSTFPGGAVLFSGLSLLTGWFLKRPGEDKAVAKEKEDSYNAGLAKGQELAQKIKEEINA
jgi:hypothetical protein